MTDERAALRKIAALNFTDAELGEFRLIARKALAAPQTTTTSYERALRNHAWGLAKRCLDGSYGELPAELLEECKAILRLTDEAS